MDSFNPKQYWEERLKEKWNLGGVGRISVGQYYNDWLYKVRRKVFLQHIKRLALDWKKIDVLDIGSGTGFYIDLWKSLGINSVTATDITTIAVEKLRKKFTNLKCHELDIGGVLPKEFRDRQYDVISAFDILFHIVDDICYQRAFKNISQLLRPGGIFVFSEDFIHGEAIRMQHQVSRPLKDIENILKKTGLKVKVRLPVFALMNYPVDSNSTILKTAWQMIMSPVRKFESLGFVLGGLLYPLELILTSYLKEGPSTEIMICEKPK